MVTLGGRMLVPYMCASVNDISLLDFGYLALNVYHDRADEALLGLRPHICASFAAVKSAISDGENAWVQLLMPSLTLSTDGGFYAEYYAKIVNQKIAYLVIAIRGTNNLSDDLLDYKTWAKSVWDDTHAQLTNPYYLARAQQFYAACAEVYHDLQSFGWVASNAKLYFTGHSLGGALANMHASNMLLMYPNLPRAVSFNAPGVGGMRGIHHEPAIQQRVLSMRAHYDFVSVIGVAYGYVINNHIPQGCHAAKRVFELHERLMQQRRQHPLSIENALYLLDSFDDAVIELADTCVSLLKQHSMHHFLQAMCHDERALASFDAVRHWGQMTSGMNHAERGCDYVRPN